MQGTLQATMIERRGWQHKAGHVLSGLGAAMMVLTGVLKITHEASAAERFTGAMGYPESYLAPFGTLELVCVFLYYFPRTAMIGAILLTGYLGGAVATELRLSGMLLLPLGTGALLWGGLVLRSPQVADVIRGRQTR